MTLKHSTCCAVFGAWLLMQPATTFTQAVTFDANLQAAQSTLYTDLYNGNQIKLGDAWEVTTAFRRSLSNA